jgi:hypothetical protein
MEFPSRHCWYRTGGFLCACASLSCSKNLLPLILFFISVSRSVCQMLGFGTTIRGSEDESLVLSTGIKSRSKGMIQSSEWRETCARVCWASALRHSQEYLGNLESSVSAFHGSKPDTGGSVGNRRSNSSRLQRRFGAKDQICIGRVSDLRRVFHSCYG